MIHDLRDNVALVTGGAGGLGSATCRALAGAGAEVVIADLDEAKGAALADELGGHFVTTDVTALEANEAMVARAVELTGGLDFAYLNAGVTTGCGVGEDFDLELYRRAMSVNLDGVVFGVHAVLPALRARGGGAIVIATSSAVREPVPNLALSNIVRASTAAMSKTLANELAADHIRVNHLMPGRIHTDRIDELDGIRAKNTGSSMEDVRATWAKSIPMGRYGDPAEFASGAIFLFSDAARYITGATLQVDGGMIKSVS